MINSLLKKRIKVSAGIDISQDALTLCVVEDKNGSFYLKNYIEEKFEEELVQNGSLNSANLIYEAIRALKEKQDFNFDSINLAISSDSIFIKTMTLPNFSKEELIEIVKTEAPKHISFSMDDVNFDFEIIESSRRMENAVNKVDVIFGDTKKLVNDYLTIFKDENINISSLDVKAFANIRTIGFSELIDKKDANYVSVLVDKKSTDINILNNGIPIFSYNVLNGNDDIKNSVQANFGISEDGLKAIFSKISNNQELDSLEEQIINVIKSSYNNIISEVQKTIEFYNSQQQQEDISLEKVIFSGFEYIFEDLDTYLTNKLKVDVEISKPLDKLNTTEVSFAMNSVKMHSSLGLALKGFEN